MTIQEIFSFQLTVWHVSRGFKLLYFTLFIIASPKWPTAVNWYATESARLVHVFYDFMLPFFKNFTFSGT